jgi:hypothetical protein
VPLHTLEQQQEGDAPRSSSAEQGLSGGAINGGAVAQSPRRRPAQSQMMPPPSAPSLYSSLISKDTPSAVPSSQAHKRARHSSPANPPASPKPKASTSTSAHGSSPSPRSSRKKKKLRATSPSVRSVASTRSGRGVDVEMHDGGSTTELEDLSAAAALTSLLHNTTTNTANNSSGSGASVPHSPTPSHASSFTELGAPTAGGSGIHRREGSHLSASGLSAASGVLSPRGSLSLTSSQGGRATPKPASDADAAEMMLYLATSPSPARPAVRRPERVLSRNAGRVLFPSGDSVSSLDDGDLGTQSEALDHAKSDAGPSRPTAYSMGAFDRPRAEIGGVVEYSHNRTRTAPEIIYPGDFLPAPLSPPGTLYGGSQEFRNSQQTAVGVKEDEGFEGKGKGKSANLPPNGTVPAMQISSPMSVDEPDTGSGGSGFYSRDQPDHPDISALHMPSIPPRPSPIPFAKRVGSPPLMVGYGTSDVRGAGRRGDADEVSLTPSSALHVA